MKLTSSAFEERGDIPSKYTCDGENISPALIWAEAPANVKSFALIVDDPDAPSGTFVHWVLYHLPPSEQSLPENVPHSGTLSSGAMQGRNGFGKMGYGGPCPPSGTHRYFFHLYALDAMLPLHSGVSRAELDRTMKGHVIGEAQLMGKYQRKK